MWLIKEHEENEEYSEQSADANNNSDEGHEDSYADIDSDENILTVPTAKGGMRRKHHRPWTLSEVVKLVEGVSRHGAGRWSEIKRIAFANCSHRTSVDLKVCYTLIVYVCLEVGNKNISTKENNSKAV